MIHQILVDIASLKSEVDKLDIDNLETTQADFSRLSDVVNNDFTKKAEYSKLFSTFNAIDTSGFALKKYHNVKKIIQHNIDKLGIEKKLMMLTKSA